jgi:hypothetical protein
MPCAPRMRIRTAKAGARRRGSSRRNGSRRSSDKKSCLAFRTTGVSGTAGKEPKVLIRRRSKQYVRRILAGSSHGPPVRSQDATDEPTKDVLGGMDNSDSACRDELGRSHDGRPRPLPPRRKFCLAQRSLDDEPDDVLPEPDDQARSGTGGGLFRGDLARTLRTPTQDRGGSCMSRTEWLGEPAIVLGVKILRARRTL